MKTTKTKCAECGKSLPRNYGRGLCWVDYRLAYKEGRLYEYERETRPNDELIAEMFHLGLDPRMPLNTQFKALGPRMGMKPAALSKAWYRAARRESENHQSDTRRRAA